jgi:AcrR family transcriptional regulator
VGALNGGDPATAARIRAAAMAAFAAYGDAVSTTAIAHDAGVSEAALEHHFPTRTALREAVNEHVLSLVVPAFAGFDPRGGSDDEIFDELAERVTSVMRDHPDALLYVGRAAIDGDPGGLGIFDAFMAIATGALEELAGQGRLDPDLDVQWAALHVVIFNLSTLLFEQAVESHLPERLRSPAGIARWHAADTELFRRGFLRASLPRG